MRLKAQIMGEEDIARALKRIAHQIIEKNHGTEDLCLIGIKTRGIPLAWRIAGYIAEIEVAKGNEAGFIIRKGDWQERRPACCRQA